MTRISLVIAALLLSACQEPPQLGASDAWVRLPPVKGRPGAGYMTITGGEAPARLISISSPVATRTEMHDTVRADGMMQMRAMDGLDVPANATIAFAPGGRHAMLFNINPGIKPGSRVPLVLTFADGRRITVSAAAQAAGDPPPTKED